MVVSSDNKALLNGRNKANANAKHHCTVTHFSLIISRNSIKIISWPQLFCVSQLSSERAGWKTSAVCSLMRLRFSESLSLVLVHATVT